MSRLKEKARKTGEGVDGKKSSLLLVLPREVQKGLEIFLRVFQFLGNRFDTVDAVVGRRFNWQFTGLLAGESQPQQSTEEGEEDRKFGAGETIAIPDRFEQVAVEGVVTQILKGQRLRER